MGSMRLPTDTTKRHSRYPPLNAASIRTCLALGSPGSLIAKPSFDAEGSSLLARQGQSLLGVGTVC